MEAYFSLVCCRLERARSWDSLGPPVFPSKHAINLAEEEVEEVGERVDEGDEEERDQARHAHHGGGSGREGSGGRRKQSVVSILTGSGRLGDRKSVV